MSKKLKSLFSPKSIAVIGVSEDQTKLGTVIYNNIISAGYTGKTYLVNPKYQELFDQKVHSDTKSIKSKIDLAVIVIPSKYVLESFKDCIASGVKSVIVISAGFKETGKEGNKLEQEIAELAKDNDINLLGPNCLGIMVPGNNLNASFGGDLPLNGNVAFLSQSGAVNTAILDLAAAENFGFSHFVSLGNKAGITEMELMKEWFEDKNVKVIAAYLEEFTDGRDLVELIRDYPEKPVVILHPGESNAAQEAMSSHTGSLAGDAELIRTSLAKAGVIQVNSIEKLFGVIKLLAWGQDRIIGNRVAIITNAGGPGIMLTDLLVQSNDLVISQLLGETKDELRNNLPDTASVHNPVDLVGDAKANRYEIAIKTLTESDEVDAILVLLTPQFITEIVKTSQVIVDLYENTDKLIIPIFIGEKSTSTGLDILSKNQVPAFQFGEEAAAALSGVIHRHRSLKRLKANSEVELPTAGQFTKQVNKHTGGKLKPLPEDLVMKLAEEVGLKMPAYTITTKLDSAVEFMREYGHPIVLKATTADIQHKTDYKAVYLNIENESQLQQSFAELRQTIINNSKKQDPKVIVQQQITDESRFELIMGANRDGEVDVYQPEGLGFGHLLVFGKGGIYTNIEQDISTGLAPLTKPEMKEMATKTKVWQIISGAREQQALATDLTVETLMKLQNLVLMYPQIKSVDINPALVTKDDCIVVDLKVFVQE